ncbi:MAG: leucyl aminopeptidase [Alphaproteobacteria bacterium]|nr:leucyl aminopeptidase [Alphaproteobacteria bacterium]
MKFSFDEPDLGKKGVIAVAVAEGRKLGAAATRLDRQSGGAIRRALAGSKFDGKLGELLDIVGPAGVPQSHIVLYGLGKAEDLIEGKAEDLGGGLLAQLRALPDTAAAIVVDGGAGLPAPRVAAHMAYGAQLRSYRFDKYRTKLKKDDQPKLDRVTVMLDDSGAAKRAFAPLEKVAEAIAFARDLVAEPANVVFPASMATRVLALKKLGLAIEVLDLKAMQKLKMGALLGVAQGSLNEPRMVTLRWNGGARGKAPIAFIGKGVTFDSGGLSLKTAKGMEDMKWDMAGSAAVVGTMAALAGRKAKVNAVGVIALVENMPSGTAQRPCDIVSSASGQTIEVLNTDAEGRLILADAMWYAQDRFKPVAMIELSTLTGAIITSLGHEHAGMFANDDKLADELTQAGKGCGETVWRMPLGEAYDKQINSDIADMKNIGEGNAGSIVAAQFLKRFVDGDLPWAHLDIAGVAWSKKDAPTVPKGATAWGVRLLDRLVRDKYEG